MNTLISGNGVSDQIKRWRSCSMDQAKPWRRISHVRRSPAAKQSCSFARKLPTNAARWMISTAPRQSNNEWYCQVKCEGCHQVIPTAYSKDAHLCLSLTSSSLPRRDYQSLRLVIFPLRTELPRRRRNVSDARRLPQL
jgi:hypothetical protein